MKKKQVAVYEFDFHKCCYYLVKCPKRVKLMTVYRSGNILVDDVLSQGLELKIIPYEKCTENSFHIIELESGPF